MAKTLRGLTIATKHIDLKKYDYEVIAEPTYVLNRITVWKVGIVVTNKITGKRGGIDFNVDNQLVVRGVINKKVASGLVKPLQDLLAQI